MHVDVLVVGGGLAGLSFAAALSGANLKIALIENATPQRPSGWDPRIYAISPTNIDFLRSLGIWQRLDQTRVSPVHRMAVFGDSGGKLDFSAYDSGLDALAWIVEAGLLQAELWETVRRQHNLTLFSPAQPVALEIDNGYASLSLDAGQTLHAKLIVAADGARSWVRQARNIPVRVTPYHELGVVANFECEYGHSNTAYQWFADQGILAYLPLPGKKMSMVWSVPEAFGSALLELDEETFCDRVAKAGDHTLGTLRCITPPSAFPLKLMQLDSPVSQRLALIGDAAHAIHPLSGHGINLGFQDARSLASLLQALPSWRDPGEAALLARHARARAEETRLMQTTTHALNRVFKQDNPLLATLRNFGLNLTNNVPVLRNALTRYAVQGHF